MTTAALQAYLVEEETRNRLEVPHNGSVVRFSIPNDLSAKHGEYPTYVGNFSLVRGQLQSDRLLPPNLSEVASLLYTAHQCSTVGVCQDLLERQLQYGCLWAFNHLEILPGQGLYIDDRMHQIPVRADAQTVNSQILPARQRSNAQQVLVAIAGKAGATKLHRVSDRFGGRLYVDTAALAPRKQPTQIAPYLATTRGPNAALWLCFEQIKPVDKARVSYVEGSMYGIIP